MLHGLVITPAEGFQLYQSGAPVCGRQACLIWRSLPPAGSSVTASGAGARTPSRRALWPHWRGVMFHFGGAGINDRRCAI